MKKNRTPRILINDFLKNIPNATSQEVIPSGVEGYFVFCHASTPLSMTNLAFRN
jgi:hypothetical protein